MGKQTQKNQIVSDAKDWHKPLIHGQINLTHFLNQKL